MPNCAYFDSDLFNAPGVRVRLDARAGARPGEFGVAD
jgi:hypothetical protein